MYYYALGMYFYFLGMYCYIVVTFQTRSVLTVPRRLSACYTLQLRHKMVN